MPELRLILIPTQYCFKSGAHVTTLPTGEALTIDNALESFEQASKCSAEHLRKMSGKLALKNIRAIVKTPAFRIHQHVLTKILEYK